MPLVPVLQETVTSSGCPIASRRKRITRPSGPLGVSFTRSPTRTFLGITRPPGDVALDPVGGVELLQDPRARARGRQWRRLRSGTSSRCSSTLIGLVAIVGLAARGKAPCDSARPIVPGGVSTGAGGVPIALPCDFRARQRAVTRCSRLQLRSARRMGRCWPGADDRESRPGPQSTSSPCSPNRARPGRFRARP